MAKILVVEDEFDLRETLVEELSDEGHLAIEAGNGVEGLEQLSAHVPDMIISDITMPEMNGYQFFRSVKEQFPEHEFTPFIFLSALSEREDQLKGLRLGVDDYLTKPVDFDLLMAKIDLNLRRHMAQVKRPQTEESAAPDNISSETNDDAASPIERLGAIVRDNGGHVLVGRIETAGAEILEERHGIDWEENTGDIQALALATLKEHLGPKDAIQVLPPQTILIAFADITESALSARVNALRDAVWEALFGKWNDEGLATVTTQPGSVTLDPEQPIEDDTVFAEIEERLREDREASREADLTALLENHRSKSLYALKLLTPTSAPSKIKMLNFEKTVLLENREILNKGHHNLEFLTELNACLFKRLTEKKAFKEAFSKGAMLLPIRFELVDHQDTRDQMTELCLNLKESLGTTIIVELVESPDRFHTHIDALKPLPIGGQVHFVELRRLEQLGSLELGQLSELGVAFFTMRFEHALQQDAAVLRHLIQTLQDSGVKFYIKEIPDGKLSEAQKFGAHLYSMH